MTRCPEECEKQWRPKQGKLGWQKQEEEKRRSRKETRREGIGKERKEKT